MKTLCSKCNRPITGRQGQIQHMRDGEPIRNYHKTHAPKLPEGWSTWDTRDNLVSKMFGRHF